MSSLSARGSGSDGLGTPFIGHVLAAPGYTVREVLEHSIAWREDPTTTVPVLCPVEAFQEAVEKKVSATLEPMAIVFIA